MNNLLHQSKRFISRNAATILTCVGGVGVVATTVVGIKATPKALKLLELAEEAKGEELTKVEKVRIAGPSYIPTLLLGASTIACIFGANFLNKRQQAALISAYALLDNSYKEYRGKMKELYGEEADLRIVEEIAKDRYDEEEDVPSDGTQLFYESFSGRYFESTIEKVQQVEYNINYNLNTFCEATLNEYYEMLGLEPTEQGKILGWNSGMLYEYYCKSWIDFLHHKTTLDDGLECTIIELMTEPEIEYDQY